jgi:hypothetical protein
MYLHKPVAYLVVDSSFLEKPEILGKLHNTLEIIQLKEFVQVGLLRSLGPAVLSSLRASLRL